MRFDRPSNRPYLTIAAAAAIGAGLLAGGCSHNQTASNNEMNSEQPAAVASTPASSNLTGQQLYDAHRYSEAKAKSLQEASTQNGHEKEVSMLTAGLSAHAMKQYDEAVTILTPLTRSEDSRIAGRAKSAIDYIGIERGRGNAAQASAARTITTDDTSGPITPSKAKIIPSNKGYAIQAGSFSTLANAQKRATELKNQSAQAGLGTPKVVPQTKNGKRMYAVQVGSFPTKQAANAALGRLSGPLTVTAVP